MARQSQDSSAENLYTAPLETITVACPDRLRAPCSSWSRDEHGSWESKMITNQKASCHDDRSHMRTRTPLLVLATCCWLALPGSAAAQTEQEDLAKTVQNPLASLVSLPFQANYNNGVGEHDRLFSTSTSSRSFHSRARSGTSSHAPSSRSTACPWARPIRSSASATPA